MSEPGTYRRVSDHVQSVDASAAHAGAAAADHEDEPMDRGEWQDHAVDPRENRE